MALLDKCFFALFLACFCMESSTIGQEKKPDRTDIALASIKEMGGSANLVISNRNMMEWEPLRINMTGEMFSDDSLGLLQDLRLRLNQTPGISVDKRLLERSLVGLSLENSSVTDAGLEFLGSNDFGNLKFSSISLQSTEVTDNGLRFLSELKNLKNVNLSSTKVTDNGLRFLLALKNVTNVNLSNTNVTNDGLRLFSELKNLTHVDLSNTKITGDGLRFLSELKHLTYVDLTKTNIIDNALVFVSELSRVQIDGLSNTKTNEPIFRFLKECKSLPTVKLGDRKLSVEQLRDVANSRRKLMPYPRIDGVFDDWPYRFTIARDAERESDPGPVGAFDIQTVFAQNIHTTLFLKVELKEAVQLQNGPEGEETLRLDLNLGDKGILTVDFRGRSATLKEGELITRVPWSSIGFVCLPTYAADCYEMKLDLGKVGVNLEDEIELDFTGSDQLYSPEKLKLVVRDDVQSLKRAEFERSADTGFRIANLNTRRNGLANAERGKPIHRLIKAANADLYCFQEEWDEEQFRTGVPDGLNAIWSGGCAIASKYALKPVAMKLDSAIAGSVSLPNSKEVVIISAHFECCGYAGSKEDQLRIQQAEQILGEIKKFRKSNSGERIPIVLIGDYNLVGSRKPLDVLNSSGLTDYLLRCPEDGSAYTWRGLKPEEEFSPGRLDLVSHSSKLKPIQGLLLDTGRLSDQDLNSLGLKSDDSLASDHLMLIADFEFSEK